MRSSLARWADILRSASAGVLACEPSLTSSVIGAFADESGHRRDTDGPFLSAVARLPFAAAGGADAQFPDDVRLWSAAAARVAPPAIASTGTGPLFQQEGVSLEVYTERLLCAMHAAHRLALDHNRPDWWRRITASAAWFAGELQPDNATNHPWAVGVFAAVACEMHPEASESTDAGLIAQTLLSNCQVMHGRPSRLAAYILEDAAQSLSRHAQAGW